MQLYISPKFQKKKTIYFLLSSVRICGERIHRSIINGDFIQFIFFITFVTSFMRKTSVCRVSVPCNTSVHNPEEKLLLAIMTYLFRLDLYKNINSSTEHI